MSYTRQALVDMAYEMTQGQVTKLPLLAWCDVAIQDVIHRKRAWWRRKSFAFSSSAGTPTYDLKESGLDLADDFHQMIGLYRLQGNDEPLPVKLLTDPGEIARALSSTEQGEPGFWFPEPGEEKVLRLTITPGAAYDFRSVYWAAPNLSPDNTDDAIPLIPSQFHHVPMLRFIQKLHEYLYGIKDPRYATSEREYERAAATLDLYSSPGIDAGSELRVRDPIATVRSTS